MSAASEELLDLIEKELPTYFTREEASAATRGLLSKQTLAHYEHIGIGPKTHYLGRRVYYIRSQFMEWMRNYYGGMNVVTKGFVRTVRRGKRPPNGTGTAGEGA